MSGTNFHEKPPRTGSPRMGNEAQIVAACYRAFTAGKMRVVACKKTYSYYLVQQADLWFL